jgi:hypothetical protein
MRVYDAGRDLRGRACLLQPARTERQLAGGRGSDDDKGGQEDEAEDSHA